MSSSQWRHCLSLSCRPLTAFAPLRFLTEFVHQIAWLFNLRGSDILCNPVFFAYAVVLKDGPTTLFVRRPDSKGLKPHLQAAVSLSDRPFAHPRFDSTTKDVI